MVSPCLESTRKPRYATFEGRQSSAEECDMICWLIEESASSRQKLGITRRLSNVRIGRLFRAGVYSCRQMSARDSRDVQDFECFIIAPYLCFPPETAYRWVKGTEGRNCNLETVKALASHECKPRSVSSSMISFNLEACPGCKTKGSARTGDGKHSCPAAIPPRSITDSRVFPPNLDPVPFSANVCAIPQVNDSTYLRLDFDCCRC